MRKLIHVGIVAAAITACQDAGPTGPYATVAGTYQLATVNESPLPYTFLQNSTSQTKFLSGRLILRADSTYSNSLEVRTLYSSGAFESDTWGPEQGRFTIISSEITFTIPASGDMTEHSYKGKIRDGVVILPIGTMALRYVK